MDFSPGLYESSKYRCLAYPKQLSEKLYLLLCGVETCLPEYEFHSEGRNGYHLHVILSGKGTLCVNGLEQDLHFGQLFVTKPGEETWYRADAESPWTYCWMAYDGADARRCTEAAGFLEGVNWLNCNEDPSKFFALVQRVLDQPELNLASDLKRLGLLMEYLALAIESGYRGDSSLRRDPEYSADVYVNYAVNYIQANYPTAKVTDVASYIGINRSYLTNIFKKRMGVSPQEYLMQCRMKKACDLLLETELSVQEISLRVGYENALTFSKIFKTYYGRSPKHFRNEKRGSSDKENLT